MKPASNTSSTKPKWKKWAIWAAPIVALLVLARAFNSNPPTNRAQTSPDASDAALRTRFYNAPIENVEVATRKAVLQLRSYGQSWRFSSDGFVDEAGARVVAIEVPVLMFVDDLKVTLESENGKTRVDVESNSRVGKGDFGENRRHVLQLLNRLDEQLNAAN